jgi:hypothetical protein
VGHCLGQAPPRERPEGTAESDAQQDVAALDQDPDRRMRETSYLVAGDVRIDREAGMRVGVAAVRVARGLLGRHRTPTVVG